MGVHAGAGTDEGRPVEADEGTDLGAGCDDHRALPHDDLIGDARSVGHEKPGLRLAKAAGVEEHGERSFDCLLVGRDHVVRLVEQIKGSVEIAERERFERGC